MRIHLLASVGLIALFLFGCNQQDRLFTPGKVSLADLMASAPAPTPTPVVQILEKSEERINVHALTVEKEITGKAPAEIVFLLDNSYSMSDDLLKLRSALQTLQGELTKSAIDYRIRFLSLSQAKSLAGQRYGTNGARGTVMSNLLFAGASPFSAPVFDRKSDAAQVSKAAETASNIDASLQYEMGIGLAAAFVNWNQLGTTEEKAKLRPGHIHFVVLSNEDNYNGVNNLRGSNSSLLPLYTYTKDIYRGYATKWGFCQAGAWAPKATASVPAQRLRSSLYHVKDSAIADIGQGTAISGSAVGAFLCRTNRYGNLWWSNDLGTGYQVCNLAKKTRCPSNVDGITVWSSGSGLSSLACQPDAAEYTPKLVATNLSASTAVEPGSCDAVVCERAAKYPSETYAFKRDTFGVITQIDVLPPATGYTARDIPSAAQNVKDTCPGELGVTPPPSLTLSAITSANSTSAFDYAAAPGMTREAVRAHVASLKGTATEGIVFSEEPSMSNKDYTASAEGFYNLLRDVHPQLGRVLWHSIVSDGNRCGNATMGGEISSGAQYGELSRLTGGAIENICAPSFGPFLEKVAVSVQYGPVLHYPLDAAVAGHVRKVENKTRGILLAPDRDYRVTASSLELSATAPVGPADVLHVSYTD